MLYWICEGIQFLKRVARGQALHFWVITSATTNLKEVYIGSTYSFTFCYKKQSLLLLETHNINLNWNLVKAAQQNKSVSTLSGVWLQLKHTDTSEAGMYLTLMRNESGQLWFQKDLQSVTELPYYYYCPTAIEYCHFYYLYQYSCDTIYVGTD